jgi:crossover junction endodeoxyribonuclease RusA
MITELHVTVHGRPAPQGSKRFGAHGQLREASAYLPAWRAAIKKAVYEQYKTLGVPPEDLPLLRGAVAIGMTFWMGADRRIDGPPDLDKLQRAVWDALTGARVWEDDARVTEVLWACKAPAAELGVDLLVRSLE